MFGKYWGAALLRACLRLKLYHSSEERKDTLVIHPLFPENAVTASMVEQREVRGQTKDRVLFCWETQIKMAHPREG